MKQFKYPDNKHANFGITDDGEFFAGDLSASGKRLTIRPGFNEDTTIFLNGYLQGARGTYRGYVAVEPRVKGRALFNPSIRLTPTDMENTLCRYLRGGKKNESFTSKMGITKGKTYRTTGLSTIVDENDQVVFNVSATGRGNETLWANGTTITQVNTITGTPVILFESETHFFVLVQGHYHSQSSLFYVTKEIPLTGTGSNWIIASGMDVEWLGVDTENRNIFIMSLDWVNSSETAITGLSGQYLRPFYGAVVRQTSEYSTSFSVVSTFQWCQDAYPAISGGYRARSQVGFSLSNCVRKHDENGKLLGAGLLTNEMNAYGYSEANPMPTFARWTWFDLSVPTPTQTNTVIALPDSYKVPIYRTTSNNHPGFAMQCTQWAEGNKVYAVFSQGSLAKNMRYSLSGARVADIPILIMEMTVDSSTGIPGDPTWTEIPEDNYPGFYWALLDDDSRRLWWFSEDAFTSETFQVRCLDVDTKSLDRCFINEALQTAGVQDGRLLLTTIASTFDTYKHVLEPEVIPVQINLSFDKQVYNKGDSATLTISTNSQVDLIAVLELDGCNFLDGTYSQTIQIPKSGNITLPVTIKTGAVAEISDLRHAQETTV